MIDELLNLVTLMPKMHVEWLSLVLNEDYLLAIITLCLFTLLLIEIFKGSAHEFRRILIRSYLTNIAMFVFNNSVLSLLSVTSLLVLADKNSHNGLLSLYHQPLQILCTFVLFDFVLYLWHRANHDYDCLWMFHKVHHCDKSMNVTTAFRVHFIEVLLSTLIKALYIILTGVEATVVAFCEGVSTLFIMFHHLNFSLRSEKWLKWLFVVPSLHRVHHSELRTDHDSNYGAIFSVWDRLFRTITDAKPVEVGLVGVPALTFVELLKFGLFSGNAVPAPAQVPDKTLQVETINAMIAEAAFYNAEKRDFIPGNDFQDWFEAEKQIMELNCVH